MQTFLVTDKTAGSTIAFSSLAEAMKQASFLVSLGHDVKVEEINVSVETGGK